MRTIKNKQYFCLLIFLTTFMLTGWMSNLSAQNAGSNDRYNLAVYATGLQNDQPISASLLTVVQNKTITKLTGEGNYRLIERSNEFLRQIQNEQTLQQSGEVADEQIADVGAGYGAQKVCVVSITIVDKYLYIATRIVDVATKTSYESGDAEVTDYNSIPVLTKALESALNRMIAKGGQQATKIQSDNISMSTSSNIVGQTRADYNAYIKRLKSEKGGFLKMNSMAYKEYMIYRGELISGLVLSGIGAGLMIPGWIFMGMYGGTSGLGLAIPGTVATISGVTLLCIMNNHLKKSYKYYLNGDQQTATLQFYPYYGSNNTFGAGLTLRFRGLVGQYGGICVLADARHQLRDTVGLIL